MRVVEAGGDVRLVVFETLEDADDGQIRFAAKRGDMLRAVGTQAACSAAEDRDGDAAQGICVIEGITRECLTGNNQLVF